MIEMPEIYIHWRYGEDGKSPEVECDARECKFRTPQGICNINPTLRIETHNIKCSIKCKTREVKQNG
jgi:hypothetical protein